MPARARLADFATRAARDTALASLIGANVFGRFALNPALEQIGDQAERGKVLNRAWRRYGIVNSGALATLVAERVYAHNTGRARLLDDAGVGAIVITGLASGVSGIGFARQAPGGAVAMRSGHDPAPDTPPQAARLKRIVNLLGALNLAAALAMVLRGARA